MHWLLIGYMALFIHRPFEFWAFLADFRVERLYMIVTLLAFAAYPGKRWLPNVQHAAYLAMAAAVALAWAASPWADKGQGVTEDWFKIFTFYVLLVCSVSTEPQLRLMVRGFLAVMAVYMLHSLWEYVCGRHLFRMGIARLIGVDMSQGDPNSFGASIVFSLPFVLPLWRAAETPRDKWLLRGYVALSVLCVLLTGSRSSLLGLVVWAGVEVWRSPNRTRWAMAAVVASPLVFLALPDSLQNRFETIINPDVGPANAKQSGDGRLVGLMLGLELWQDNPLTGVGPGAFRPATGSDLEAHSLVGQLAGETGTLGILAFLSVIAAFALNGHRVRRGAADGGLDRHDFLPETARAACVGVGLMLFLGLFGHNLYRHNWLWYGGFLVIARHCLAERLAAVEFEEEQYEVYPEWQRPPAFSGRGRASA